MEETGAPRIRTGLIDSAGELQLLEDRVDQAERLVVIALTVFEMLGEFLGRFEMRWLCGSGAAPLAGGGLKFFDPFQDVATEAVDGGPLDSVVHARLGLRQSIQSRAWLPVAMPETRQCVEVIGRGQ